MQFRASTFGKLLEAIDRRHFQAMVARHKGDAYDKSFRSWDHLVALIFAQFSVATSLRGVETSWNAGSNHHYHLGCGPLRRATLADANARRPAALFAETFAMLAGQLDRKTRRDGVAMLRLIDSTPVPLGKRCPWAKSNGRIRGMKVHVVYDPQADQPRVLDITDATVNDAAVGRTLTPERGATYVFDKGYCHYGWWTAIAQAGAVFVTRPKTNMGLRCLAERPVAEPEGCGFTVLEDADVVFASKGDSKLPLRLRRIVVRRHDDRPGRLITLLTNDRDRPAAAIGALYKSRWQIELLFRWIKQHLRLRVFLGRSPNAVRLQIFAAMIAYALLRIAARTHSVRIPILRFTDLVAQCLFDRRNLGTIEKPPPVNPSHKRDKTDPNQMAFTYV